MAKERKAQFSRKTKETVIDISLNLDGKGEASIHTGSGFFDHMMELFAKHGLFDLSIQCKGDTQVDLHHSIEDIGICLGKVIDLAVGDKMGIRRYGLSELPMDEALAKVVLDLGGRPYLVFRADLPKKKVNDFDCELAEEFFQALSVQARMNIHIDLIRGKNIHHSLEAIFKAFAKALDQATQIDNRSETSLPSTKGLL